MYNLCGILGFFICNGYCLSCVNLLQTDAQFVGRTALHEACAGGHLAMAEKLIRAGADTNLRMVQVRTHFSSYVEFIS
jgi:hypothetical protein